MILPAVSQAFRGEPFVPVRRWSEPLKCWALGTASVGVSGEYTTKQLGEYSDGVLRVTADDGSTWSMPYEPVADLTFASDQQGNPLFGLRLERGPSGILWRSPITDGYEFVTVDTSGVVCVTVDDPTRAAFAEVAAFYVRDGVLFYRQQSERFTVERSYAPFPGVLVRAFPVRGKRFEIHGRPLPQP